MSRIIITGGTVLTINDADDVHFGGHVVLDGDRITAVAEGPYTGAPGDGDQVIDASGKIIMPGLVDLHYHTAIAKGFSDHLPLWEYLDACWYPFVRTLDADAAYWAAAASYLESIKCGVTTVNDMYRRLPDLGRAAADIGIRAVLSNDVALPEHNLDTLQDNQDAYDAVHGLGGGRIEVYVGIEWLPLASPELLRDARALADELGTGIHIHLNESLTEVENSKERFGRRPTEVAYDAGLLGRRTIAAHCVWLSDTDPEGMVKELEALGVKLAVSSIAYRPASVPHQSVPTRSSRSAEMRADSGLPFGRMTIIRPALDCGRSGRNRTRPTGVASQ